MNYAKYIDPIIGTVGDEDQEETSCHGGGKTHPGACTPGGMVQMSPDTITGGDNGTGYSYCHNTIEGFSFNHMSGIGWYGDLGNLQIMPIIGEASLRSGTNESSMPKKTEGWRSGFSHEKETAKAGYYSVFLERYNIFAEATATVHTGHLRFTYPESDNAGLIFNLSRRIGGKADWQSVEIIDETHLKGTIRCTPAGGGFGHGHGNISYNLHFYCELSKPYKSCEIFSDEELLGFHKKYEGEDVGVLLRFDTEADEQISLVTGISYVDIEGAQNNFNEEYCTFDLAEDKAFSMWNDALDIVTVEGDNQTDLTVFYTCLYHTLLDPRTHVDCDGRYTGADGNIHITKEYSYRTVFSGWDVYRSEFPLLSLIAPETFNDEINSLLSIAVLTNSALPRWELVGIDAGCMVGDPAVIVIADAYMKGIRNFDAETAYAFAKANAMGATELNGKPFKARRVDAHKLDTLGYKPELLSVTLEELYSDYCLGRFAKLLGKDDDAEFFNNRSMKYKRSFNPETGFMGPLDEDGNFIPPEEAEYDEDGCVESNIYQQSWFAPHDLDGLVELFGKERFVALLERFFESADFSLLWNDDYNHSNEPCHNVTHYFNYIGLPERTQYWVRRVQKEAYRLGAFGFCGNEDVGQLSAWYVLSAIGFAQVCCADDKFQINSPLFKKATVKLNPKYHKGETFTVECDKDPLEYPFINEIYLNGNKIDRTYLHYDEIISGGTLKLIMKK